MSSPNRILLDELLDSSVTFGNLLVPARSLQSVLGNYCQHLFVWTHDPTYRVQLVGTSLPVRYRGKFFLLCSKHQLKNVEPQDVGIMYPDGSLVVTSSGFRVFNLEERFSETDAYDIAAFDFTEPLQKHPSLNSLFYDFVSAPPDVRSDYVIALLVSGFVSSDQAYELERKNHLGSVKRLLTAHLDGQPGDYSLLRARYVESLDIDPDGLSGSPVFVVQVSEGRGQSVFLGGLVLRSGKSHFFFLKSGYIKEFLDSFVCEQKA